MRLDVGLNQPTDDEVTSSSWLWIVPGPYFPGAALTRRGNADSNRTLGCEISFWFVVFIVCDYIHC